MCFSLEWIKDLLILAVVVIAIVAILQIIVSYVLAKLPPPFGEAVGIVSQVLRIVIWAIIIVAVIVFVFAMISCLWSMAGGISIFPHGR